MTLVSRSVILPLIGALLLSACGATGTANNNLAANGSLDANAPRTSVEDLRLLINLPYEAEDTVWKQDGSGKLITAVLRFDEEDTGKLAAAVEKIRPAEEVSIPMQTWFPSDLVIDSDLRGDDQLRGKAYGADPFYQSPYESGRLMRVGATDFWILELQAK